MSFVLFYFIYLFGELEWSFYFEPFLLCFSIMEGRILAAQPVAPSSRLATITTLRLTNMVC